MAFLRGQGDLTQVKPAGKTLNVTVGDGLPKTSSEYWSRSVEKERAEGENERRKREAVVGALLSSQHQISVGGGFAN